eukprot:587711-Prorocentrum_minimum.AAC.1
MSTTIAIRLGRQPLAGVEMPSVLKLLVVGGGAKIWCETWFAFAAWMCGVGLFFNKEVILQRPPPAHHGYDGMEDKSTSLTHVAALVYAKWQRVAASSANTRWDQRATERVKLSQWRRAASAAPPLGSPRTASSSTHATTTCRARTVAVVRSQYSRSTVTTVQSQYSHSTVTAGWPHGLIKLPSARGHS